MKTAVLPVVLLALLGFMVLSPLSYAEEGVKGAYYGPPLDETLMAFVDQGVWYYLCTAPVYPCRIAPRYLTYGPPPPPCCPVPYAPPPPPVPCKVR